MTQPLLPVVQEDFAQARSVLLYCSEPDNRKLFLQRSELLLRDQDPILYAFVRSIAENVYESFGTPAKEHVMATTSDAYWLLYTQSKLDRRTLPQVTPARIQAIFQDLYRATKGPAHNVRSFIREKNKLFHNENPALAEYVIDSAKRLNEKQDVKVQIAYAAGLEYWVLRSQAEADKLKEAYERV